MSLRPYAGFVGPSYTSQSKIAAFDRTVNWYPEKIESGTGNAGARYVLYPTPGYLTAQSGLDSPGRGGLTINSQMYFVSGGTLYRYPSTALASGLSNINTVTPSVVSMVTNGDAGGQLLINADSTTYAFDLTTNVFTAVGSQASSIGFVNGYGLRLDTNRSEVSFSDLEDFTAWDAEDIFQRNDAPDKWQRLLVHHKEVWLFGVETTSVYYNGEDPDIPFVPIQSVFISKGIAAPKSACVVDDAPMWLGQGADGWAVVYRASGYTPERVSTHAVEYALQQLPTLIYGEGSTYQENGHTFYELTFPSISPLLGATWVYDVTAGLWHERGAWNGLQYVELDTRDHIQLLGAQYTLSRTSGTVFQQSTTYAVGTNGAGVRRLRRAPHITQAQHRMRYSHLRLLMETGLGLATGQGSDPQMTLSWSDDGGQTFGSSYTASAGLIGAYSTLVDWWQLGQGRDRVFQVTCSDPVPFRLVDAFLDYSAGSS